jgi:ubiquinone biosynthesis monooxygenase Coq7
MSSYLERELRSNHAGETGAVYIYKGIAAIAKISNDVELLNLAKHHGATEEAHLQLIESVLANNLRSHLLVLWRIAGWLIGATPAIFGRRAVYATIAAVETFVEQHYQAQINYLIENGTSPELLALLKRCQADEIAHKNEAINMVSAELPLALRTWCSIVGWGSASAVMVARQI